MLSPLEASDREDTLTDWLDDHDIAEGWRIAPTFVQAGLDVDWLEQVAAAVDEEILPGAVGWLNYTVETELLMDEIEDSTTRISHLVDAAKQYSQLDRAPYRVVDVHELLDSTLVMLSGKIGQRIQVVKDYDRTLPPVPAYPAELNQVWTNLIDNAVFAMNGDGGGGTLTVRTARDGDRVLVEFRDTGPGYRPTSAAASSTRSSPPSRSVRAPASAWTSPGGSSSTSTTAASRSSRCRATPVSRCCCR